MYTVFAFDNMATKYDRCGWDKTCVNGCVSFSIFQEFIFIFVKQG